MHSNPTFSLNTLLTTNHLQPQLYQHMIQQIKSPLQEQSFDLTNDDSRSFERIPKRPNIPPPPPKSPIDRQQNQFSRTYDSVFFDAPQSPTRPQEQIYGQGILSVVSPLDYEVNVQKKIPSGPAVWCGNQMDKILRVEDVEGEIQFPYRNSNYRRKPIFDKRQSKKQRGVFQPSKKSRVTFENPKSGKPLAQAVDSLLKIDEPQLAAFLELMGAIERQLKQIQSEKMEMQRNLGIIYQKLSSQTNYTAQISETNDTHSRIMRRLHSRNTGEVLRKIMGRNRKKQLQGEQHLEKLFTRLNNIELIITDFLKKEEALNYLNIVYEFIKKNFSQESCFVDQLHQLYDSLSIVMETRGLALIWQHCQERKLEKSEFIEGFSLNSFIVRQENGFEDNLLAKGFQPNHD